MKSSFNKVSVVGLGYIGLPTAAVIANRGIEVIGVDVSEEVVKTINAGKTHIIEPELDVLVSAAVNSGKLRATSTAEPAEAFLVAVPTPLKGSHEPDLGHIETAAKMIAPVLAKGNLIILESTSPVGTTEHMLGLLKQERPDLIFPTSANSSADIHVAYCPERVLPGQILRELIENDRIIGGVSKNCGQHAKDLYKTFVRGEIMFTSVRTAEMCKLTENAFRDVNIAFANELSVVCDKLNINVWELIDLSNRHPRVNVLSPGPGVGGHCIAVDPWFLVAMAPAETRMIRLARDINDGKPSFVRTKILDKAQKFKNPVICCLGLTFKPNIDDLRESPALRIVSDLADEFAGKILVAEPNVAVLPQILEGKANVHFSDIGAAVAEADIVAVLVKHDEFKEIGQIALEEKVVLDFVDALTRR